MDGEFSVPKQALRREVLTSGAVGGVVMENPSTGFADMRSAVQFLRGHRSFSPQFVPSKPDNRGFTLMRRYALEADLSHNFGKIYFRR